MSNKKISELVKATSSNATDEFVLSRGATNVSIQSQYISALSASYALTASYAVSSSVEIKQEITSSYAETASYSYSTTILSGSASDARNELVTKISGSSIAPIASLSASLTVTDQIISLISSYIKWISFRCKELNSCRQLSFKCIFNTNQPNNKFISSYIK